MFDFGRQSHLLVFDDKSAPASGISTTNSDSMKPEIKGLPVTWWTRPECTREQNTSMYACMSEHKHLSTTSRHVRAVAATIVKRSHSFGPKQL